MQVWRICKEQHVADAFSGIGAERHGGRWNHKGERMVYSSTSLSLASLELFVHLEPDNLPDDLCSVTGRFPGSVSTEELEIAQLPKNWRDFPAPTDLQDLGTNWLRERRSLLLIVPSAVSPDEKNVLINPSHPEIARLSHVSSKPYSFDPRMWKRR